MQQPVENEIIRSARELLSGSFQGILSSHSVECAGYPFGSLLPYSLDRDGWPLILISHLAKHTRNLAADPHCSLTIAEQGSGDTQTLTRLSCLTDAKRVHEIGNETAERHFRYYPESRVYYRDLNFHFYRLEPVRYYCVAGFGAARWISIDRMNGRNPFTHAEEDLLLADINSQFSERLCKRLAQQIDNDSPLLAIGLDATGLDLRQNDRLLRLELPVPARNPAEYRARLIDRLSLP